MIISTFTFIAFVAGSALVYFLVPKGVRWIVLLAASLIFYACSDVRYFIFLALTAITVFFAALDQQKVNAAKEAALANAEKAEKKAIRERFKGRKRLGVAICLIINFAVLILLKYVPIILAYLQLPPLPVVPILIGPGGSVLLPLGISFYTFQAAGYLIDVYSGKVKAEGNFAKFALFVSFFPQIIQGPISRFDQLAPQLYQGHDFSYARMKSGLTLVLWGYIKKLVVSDLLLPFEWQVVTNFDRNSGTVIFITMLLYSAQLYADFSGGLDISRGICEVLGINLAKNFNLPFLSRSISEFWRRWHITLGAWFRDYVFYPLATSRAYSAASQRLRKRLSRKQADRICTSVVSLITFLLIGIWHGTHLGYALYGLWHGGIIALSTMLADVFVKTEEKLHINTEGWLWKAFQTVRTYLLVLTGFYMALPGSLEITFGMLGKTLTGPFEIPPNLTPVLTRYHFFREFPIALAGVGLILLAAVLTALGRDLRKDLERAPLPVQWLILIAGIVFVVTFGCYGPTYDATSFIYQVF